MPQLYPVQDLPLHSIPGGRMLYQLAAAEVDGQPYAIVAVGISNPFMVGVIFVRKCRSVAWCVPHAHPCVQMAAPA